MLLSMMILLIGSGWSLAGNYPAKTETINNVPCTTNPDYPKNGIKEFDLKEELSIGNDTDENYTFGRIKRVDVDDNGTICVLDGRQYQVLLFDKSGKFLRRMSSKGEGPGSQLIPNYVALDKKNKMIHILCLRLGKISRYSIDGKFDRDTKLIGGKPASIHIVPNRFYITGDVDFNDDGSRNLVISKFSLKGESMGENLVLPYNSTHPVEFKDNRMLGIKHPLMNKAYAYFANNGDIYYGYSDKYEITLYNSDLKKIQIIRRNAKRVKVRDDDKQFIYDLYRNTYIKKGYKITMDMLQMSEYYQVFEGIWKDDKNHLLVNAAHNDHVCQLDVFDQNGVYTEKWRINKPTNGIPLKDVFAAPLFIDECVYTAVLDEDGMAMIKKYRLVERQTKAVKK